MTVVLEVDPRELTEHPRNPRRGNVAAIADGIRTNGWHGVITARWVPLADGSGRVLQVLVGWHRSRAAIEVGMETVPVEVVDDTDEDALRRVISDNRASDLAYNADEALAVALRDLDALDGTLYSPEVAEALYAQVDRLSSVAGLPPTDPAAEWVGMPEFDQANMRPQHTISVHFLTIEDKARFAREVLGRDSPPRFAWWPQDDGFVGSDTGSAYVAAPPDDEDLSAAG